MGNNMYRRLYEAENTIRVVINSVLLAEIGPDWWTIAVSDNIRDQAERFLQRYRARPWHTTQGNHGIYYVFLVDLADIMRANSDFLRRSIPDVDQWVGRILTVNLPRNVVGHMNFLNASDRDRLVLFHDDVAHLPALLTAAAVPLVIP